MKRNLLKEAYLYYFIFLFTIPLGFLIRYFYTKTISVEEVGFIYSIVGFMTIINQLSLLGIPKAMRFMIPKYLVKEDFKRISSILIHVFLVDFIIIVFFSSLFFIFSGWLATNYFHDSSLSFMIELFVIFFIGLNIFNITRNLSLSFKKEKYFQIIKFFQLLLILFFSVIAYIFYSQDYLMYYSLVWGVVTFAVSLLFLLFFIYKSRKSIQEPLFEKDLSLSFFKYSFLFFAGNLGLLIISHTDLQVVTFYLGLENSGIFSNTMALVNIMISLFTPISALFLSYFSELKEKNNFTQIRVVLELFYYLFVFLILPFVLLFSLFPEKILLLIYGEEYVSGSIILAILSVFSIVRILFAYNILFLEGLGLPKKISQFVFPLALLNLILDIVLIQYLGVLGVVLTTSFIWFLMGVISTYIIVKEVNLKFDFLKVIKIISNAIIFVFLIYLLKGHLTFFNYYFNLIFILGFSFVLYFLFGYLLKIYQFKDLYVLIPNGELKSKISFYHKKYLYFIK